MAARPPRKEYPLKDLPGSAPLAYGEGKKPGVLDKNARPLGFARSLAWSTIILVIILTSVLSTFIGLEARETLFAKQQSFAALLAENLNHQIYRRFTLPTVLGFGRIALRNPAQYERLDQLVLSTIHGLDVERVRIFSHDSDNTVTYSTTREEAGQSGIGSLEVKQAASSDTPSIMVDAKFPYWKAFFQFPLEPHSFTMRTTYPLRMENRQPSADTEGPVMGILEFTQDVTSDMENVIRFQQAVILVTLLCTGTLVVVLFFFIQRAEKAMKVRMEQEQHLLQELHQNEKLAGMGRVIASIAHEIRNPLGIIRSSAELLLRRNSSEDKVTAGILNAIYDESRRLSQTVSDFLDYARPRQPKTDAVDVEKIINQAIAFLETEMHSRDVSVVCSRTADSTYAIQGDNDLLYRAFYNIIANAMQAVGNDGAVSITLGIAQNPVPSVEIVFHDSGPGFPPEHLAQVLDPFFTTKDDGTGLGLPIVNNILESHGGSVQVSNAPEGGAVVRVLLPRAQ